MINLTGRIRQQNGGMYFYEKDIIMLSEYTYHHDTIIDFDLLYQSFGFGIIYQVNDHLLYLLKFAKNTITLYKKEYSELTIINNAGCALKPMAEPCHLAIKKQGKELYIQLHYAGHTYKLDQIVLPDTIDSYNIGIYSNTGNTVLKWQITDMYPQDWLCSIKNTNGARLSFASDAMIFQNGINNTEVSQEDIALKKGKYWFSCKHDKPIDYYIFKNDATDIYAPGKNILKDDGSFTLTENSKVNLLIRAKDATVSELAIKEHQHESYVPTSDHQATQPGSFFQIHLANLKKAEWRGQINAIPEYALNEEAPYYILKYNQTKLLLPDLRIVFNKFFTYVLEHDTDNIWILSVYNEDKTILIYNQNLNIDKQDYSIYGFYNLLGEINEFLLTDDKGETVNILQQKTYKKYVPMNIKSPIMVTDIYDNPFDLSSAYRFIFDKHGRTNYVFTNYERELFSGKTDNLRLIYELHPLNDIILYGIKQSINEKNIYQIPDKDMINSIDSFAKEYDEISEKYYTVKNNEIILAESLSDKYHAYIIDYLKNDSYAINAVYKDNTYAVDIATDKQRFKTMYDMMPSGQIRTYKESPVQTSTNGKCLALRKMVIKN